MSDFAQIIFAIVFMITLFGIAILADYLERRFYNTSRGFQIFKERQATKRLQIIAKSKHVDYSGTTLDFISTMITTDILIGQSKLDLRIKKLEQSITNINKEGENKDV